MGKLSAPTRETSQFCSGPRRGCLRGPPWGSRGRRDPSRGGARGVACKEIQSNHRSDTFQEYVFHLNNNNKKKHRPTKKHHVPTHALILAEPSALLVYNFNIFVCNNDGFTESSKDVSSLVSCITAAQDRSQEAGRGHVHGAPGFLM